MSYSHSSVEIITGAVKTRVHRKRLLMSKVLFKQQAKANTKVTAQKEKKIPSAQLQFRSWTKAKSPKIADFLLKRENLAVHVS